MTGLHCPEPGGNNIDNDRVKSEQYLRLEGVVLDWIEDFHRVDPEWTEQRMTPRYGAEYIAREDVLGAVRTLITSIMENYET